MHLAFKGKPQRLLLVLPLLLVRTLSGLTHVVVILRVILLDVGQPTLHVRPNLTATWPNLGQKSLRAVREFLKNTAKKLLEFLKNTAKTPCVSLQVLLVLLIVLLVPLLLLVVQISNSTNLRFQPNHLRPTSTRSSGPPTPSSTSLNITTSH